jgi:outer membrane lipoprotein SlyB
LFSVGDSSDYRFTPLAGALLYAIVHTPNFSQQASYFVILQDTCTRCGSAQTRLLLLIILTLHFCQENNMKTTHTLAAIAVATTALLTGCASTSNDPYTNGGYNNGAYNNSASTSAGYGTIDSIQVTRGQGQTTGSGAVVGGLIGAVVGNQVGSGSGRAAATVAGAVGGAAIGNNVEANNRGAGRDQYQIGVRLDNGDYRTLVQDSVYDLRVGNRVRVVDGRAYRY